MLRLVGGILLLAASGFAQGSTGTSSTGTCPDWSPRLDQLMNEATGEMRQAIIQTKQTGMDEIIRQAGGVQKAISLTQQQNDIYRTQIASGQYDAKTVAMFNMTIELNNEAIKLFQCRAGMGTAGGGSTSAQQAQQAFQAALDAVQAQRNQQAMRQADEQVQALAHAGADYRASADKTSAQVDQQLASVIVPGQDNRGENLMDRSSAGSAQDKASAALQDLFGPDSTPPAAANPGPPMPDPAPAAADPAPDAKADAPPTAPCSAADLAAATDRLARLQSALSDIRSARDDATQQLGAGDQLQKWSNWLGSAQIAQGISDGFMSLTGFFAPDKSPEAGIKKMYDFGKKAADCVNATVFDTKTPGECVSSLATGASKLLPGESGAPLAVAGNATAAAENLRRGENGEAAESAADTVSKQLEFMGASKSTTGGIDGGTKLLGALEAAEKGQYATATEKLLKGGGDIVGTKDTILGQAYAVEGDLVKAGKSVYDGAGNLSTAAADGRNLNQVTNSAVNSILSRENDLAGKIRDAQKEVDRLTGCKQ